MIVITGASGRLGRVVSRYFPNAVLLSRKKTRGYVFTDYSLSSLKDILSDVDGVIHLAGSLDFGNKHALIEGNLSLTERLLSVLPSRTRLIYASSISVYGKRLLEIPANEDTPVNPDTWYAKTKYMAEERIRESHSNYAILRIGTLYGPTFPDYFLVLEKIKRGKMFIVGNGKNRIPFVHADDVSQSILHALRLKNKSTYVLADGGKSQEEVYRIAAELLGVEPPKLKIPYLLARLLLSFSPSFTKEHLDILYYDRDFDCSKAKKELGFSPRPIEEGIKEMVSVLKGKKYVKGNF